VLRNRPLRRPVLGSRVKASIGAHLVISGNAPTFTWIGTEPAGFVRNAATELGASIVGGPRGNFHNDQMSSAARRFLQTCLRSKSLAPPRRSVFPSLPARCQDSIAACPANALQRPQPNDVLKIVARGAKADRFS
jgi:hypothetical protein